MEFKEKVQKPVWDSENIPEKPQEPTNKTPSWKLTIRFACIVLLAGLAFKLLLCPISVVGPSMEPAYHSGDLLLSHRHSSAPLHYGDVVVFKDPTSRRMLIKRIVGLPGDTMSWNDGVMYCNDDPLVFEDAPYVFEHDVLVEPLTLEDDQVFAVGDNVNNSRDCRMFGPVSIQDVKYVIFKKLF